MISNKILKNDVNSIETVLKSKLEQLKTSKFFLKINKNYKKIFKVIPLTING